MLNYRKIDNSIICGMSVVILSILMRLSLVDADTEMNAWDASEDGADGNGIDDASKQSKAEYDGVCDNT